MACSGGAERAPGGTADRGTSRSPGGRRWLPDGQGAGRVAICAWPDARWDARCRSDAHRCSCRRRGRGRTRSQAPTARRGSGTGSGASYCVFGSAAGSGGVRRTARRLWLLVTVRMGSAGLRPIPHRFRAPHRRRTCPNAPPWQLSNVVPPRRRRSAGEPSGGTGTGRGATGPTPGPARLPGPAPVASGLQRVMAPRRSRTRPPGTARPPLRTMRRRGRRALRRGWSVPLRTSIHPRRAGLGQ